VLNTVVEFQLDSSGQARVEEEDTSTRSHKKRSMFGFEIPQLFDQYEDTVRWYSINNTEHKRYRRANAGFSRVSFCVRIFQNFIRPEREL